jgi:uncharacterized SAM-binding protein YcdF (DUF218 family)
MPGWIKLLVQPFPLLMLALGAALLWNYWRRPDWRRGLRGPLLIYGLLYLDAMPACAWWTASWLENAEPRVVTRPREAVAIVVFGGGVIAPRQPGEPTLPHPGTLARTLRGLELYRDGAPRPILVSGGRVDATATEAPVAETMATVLLTSGVPETHILVEAVSRNTAENAVESARVLREQGLTGPVVLVTHGTHLPRAAHHLRAAGVEVIPVGVGYYTDDLSSGGVWLAPRATAVSANHDTFYEACAWLKLWLTGR